MAGGRRFWAVIPAAGSSRRFAEAGYDKIKPLLRVRRATGENASMLAHVASAVPSGMHIIVVLPLGQEVPADVASSVQVARVPRTLGQADTVRRVVRDLPPDDGVLCLDCDTLMRREDVGAVVNAVIEQYDVAVAVASCDDPEMSRVDQVPHPTLFVEKCRISRWGMISARAFGSAEELSRVLDEIVEEDERAGVEPYLSGALNRYPGNKFAHEVTWWQDWGTPQKLRSTGAAVVTETGKEY